MPIIILCNHIDARIDELTKELSLFGVRLIELACRKALEDSKSFQILKLIFFDPPTHFPSAFGIAGLDFGIHMSPNRLVQTLRFFSGSLDSNTENSVWKSASGPCAN